MSEDSKQIYEGFYSSIKKRINGMVDEHDMHLVMGCFEREFRTYTRFRLFTGIEDEEGREIFYSGSVSPGAYGVCRVDIDETRRIDKAVSIVDMDPEKREELHQAIMDKLDKCNESLEAKVE